MQVFIYCKITLHISGVHRTRSHENIKLRLQPLVQVHLYQWLQLQFYVLLRMGAMDTRNM